MEIDKTHSATRRSIKCECKPLLVSVSTIYNPRVELLLLHRGTPLSHFPIAPPVRFIVRRNREVVHTKFAKVRHRLRMHKV